MWEYVGMGRTAEGLKTGIEKMKELNRTQTDDPRNIKDPFSGGIYDEIKEMLKNP